MEFKLGNKLFLFTFFLVSLIILSGCVQQGISKQEAEYTATNFVRGLSDEPVRIMNSYKEGGYWKVMMSVEDEAAVLEINAKTGKVEWISADGQRISVDEMMQGR